MLYLGSNFSTSFHCSSGTSTFLAASSLHNEHLALAHMLSDVSLTHTTSPYEAPCSCPRLCFTSVFSSCRSHRHGDITFNAIDCVDTSEMALVKGPLRPLLYVRKAVAQSLEASCTTEAAPRCQASLDRPSCLAGGNGMKTL